MAATQSLPASVDSGTLFPLGDPSPELDPAAAAVPVARSLIALQPDQLAAIHRTVALCFHIAHSTAFQEGVDADGSALVRHDPGNTGVFMGYDFHLTAAGPRLIEINTNAGGALLNGLHTAALCDPGKLEGICSELRSVEEIGAGLIETFREEMAAAGGSGARLRSVAITDEHPETQFLRSEFELFRGLFEAAGIRATVSDTGDLVRRSSGGLVVNGALLDLVYLRDTDFRLSSDRCAALREAYLAGEVVVTPPPREHHLLADKRRLAILSAPSQLRALGVSEADAAFLGEIVPETRRLADLGREAAWRSRSRWVFKPAGGFGSRAVYRGDKISRRRFEAIVGDPSYVVQERVAPGAVQVMTPRGPQTMKFDVRAYAYRAEVLLLGARVYQGQVTNFRAPGAGFSAICSLRADLDPARSSREE